MSDLDELVGLTIEVDSTGLATEGFGLLCVISHNATWPERIRYYASQADVLVDWPPDSPEAIHTAAAFAQTPHPEQVSVGRAALSVTMKYALSPISVVANDVYAANVVGQGVTETLCSYLTGTSFSLALAGKTTHIDTIVEAISLTVAPSLVIAAGAGAKAGTISEADGVTTITLDDASSQVSDFEALIATSTLMRVRTPGTQSNTFHSPADVMTSTILATAAVTNDEIVSNLAALMNAVAGKNYTATKQGTPGSYTLQVLGTAAGDWFAIEVQNDQILKNAITHTGDPTSDLAAILLAANPQPYVIDTLYNSQSYVRDTAAWVQSNGLTYAFDVCDTDVVNATSTGTADTVDYVTAAGYTRVLPQYHPRQSEALSAALEGRIISLNPGLWTAAFKSLSGPTPTKLTGTQLANLKAKRANYYTTRAGRAVTLYGMVGSTVYNFLDTVVGLDFFVNDIQTSAAGVFFGTDKIAYDDADIAQIATAIKGAITRAASDAHKIISSGTPGSVTDPIPSIVFPQVADIDPSVRALRQLPDGVLTCRLLGAVQSVAMRAVITF